MKTRITLTLSALVLAPAAVFAQSGLVVASEDGAKAATVEQLLELVSQGKAQHQHELDARESEFLARRNEQRSKLRQLEAEVEAAKDLATRLERTEADNSEVIKQRRAAYKERLGELDELFGHLQSASGDLQSSFETSLTRGQFGKERENFLRELAVKMGDSTKLPSLMEINRLWEEYHRELTESGQTARFTAQVVDAKTGTAYECDVVRVGLYGVVCRDSYLVLDSSGQADYLELARQPEHTYRDSAATVSGAVGSAVSGFVGFGIDPTGPAGNTLLRALITTPDISERIDQGGIVGRIIIFLGIVAVALAIYKLVTLSAVSRKISGQRTSAPSADNPLGRVMIAGDELQDKSNIEALENHLGEAILRERPAIDRFVNFIKIISAVAPLLGLLGTVTGMIITFQQITLFGTGDPKTMAGGISTALMTTVLGLCVAIPSLLLHAVVHSRAQAITHVLEEEATGLVARMAEQYLSKNS